MTSGRPAVPNSCHLGTVQNSVVVVDTSGVGLLVLGDTRADQILRSMKWSIQPVKAWSVKWALSALDVNPTNAFVIGLSVPLVSVNDWDRHSTLEAQIGLDEYDLISLELRFSSLLGTSIDWAFYRATAPIVDVNVCWNGSGWFSSVSWNASPGFLRSL